MRPRRRGRWRGKKEENDGKERVRREKMEEEVKGKRWRRKTGTQVLP